MLHEEHSPDTPCKNCIGGHEKDTGRTQQDQKEQRYGRDKVRDKFRDWETRDVQKKKDKKTTAHTHGLEGNGARHPAEQYCTFIIHK